MASHSYLLGSVSEIDPLYPPAKFVKEELKLTNAQEVIAHYTTSSLALDGFADPDCEVSVTDKGFEVTIEAETDVADLKSFAERHCSIMSSGVGGKALVGQKMMEELGVWNPMEGYPVNGSPSDGKCKWNIFLPLGMGMVNHAAVTLLHYPPWQALAEASYLNNMTLERWVRLLKCVGIDEDKQDRYKTIIDVNPVAAPGSGQSEYPNDFFPIMMSSAFFDGAPDHDYIRSMLELYLNPPYHKSKTHTLPLLIGGSPLYDPQAPGWFRAAFKDVLPKNRNGSPEVSVMQSGSIRLNANSEKETPYMIANHMIAAGVTGRCTDDSGKIPDIRVYEAQDLVAATFLTKYADDPSADPIEVRKAACMRWFGNEEGTGAPAPPAEDDQLTICALAQMDLFFEFKPKPHPRYTWEEAVERCKGANNGLNPCCGSIAPKDGKE